MGHLLITVVAEACIYPSHTFIHLAMRETRRSSRIGERLCYSRLFESLSNSWYPQATQNIAAVVSKEASDSENDEEPFAPTSDSDNDFGNSITSRSCV